MNDLLSHSLKSGAGGRWTTKQAMILCYICTNLESWGYHGSIKEGQLMHTNIKE